MIQKCVFTYFFIAFCLFISQSLSLHILAVDDMPLNLIIVKRVLEQDGHKVTLASNGQDGFEAVHAEQFDLVLMDIHMPVMDGITATERIRALGGKFATLPIIAYTTAMTEDEIRHYIQAGVTSCLRKPASPTVLRRAINDITLHKSP